MSTEETKKYDFAVKTKEIITLNEGDAGLKVSGDQVTLYFSGPADRDSASASDILVLALGRVIAQRPNILMLTIDEIDSISQELSVSSDTEEEDNE